MSIPVRHLLAARRHAVTTGEVRRMWPGAAWDVAALLWWRGIYWPVMDRIRPSYDPHAGCPHCYPSALELPEATP